VTHNNVVVPSAANLPTVCVLCSHNCGIRVDVEDNAIIKIRPDKSNPITTGYLCSKGHSIPHTVRHKQRVTEPLKRRPDGGFDPISWDQAIEEIAAKLVHIRDTYTGNALALIGSGGQANHLDGAYVLTLMRALGSKWWFNALNQEKSQHALTDRWMLNAPPTVFLHADAERSQFVLMMGTNPMLSNRGSRAPELIKTLRSDPKRTLVVVDPRRTETARKADQHIGLRPGTDVYLMLGMVKHILDNGLQDDGANALIRGLNMLSDSLKDTDTEWLASRCGISHRELTDLAEGFAKAESASIFLDLGVEQSRFSTLTAYLMRVLSAVTGNLGRAGGNVFLGTFGSEGPVDKPFVAPESGIEGIPMWTPFGAFSPNLFPEEALADRPDRIRGAIVEGSNPMIQSADLQRQREAFESLELLVVIDPAMSETARLAHYVLPAASGYAKWEYAGFPKAWPEIYAQVRPPVLKPEGQALPEAEIHARLARATGVAAPASKWMHRRVGAASNPLLVPAYLGGVIARGLVRTRDPDKLVVQLLYSLYETVGATLANPALTFIWWTCISYAMTNIADIRRAHPELKTRNRFKAGIWLYQQLMNHPEGFLVAKLDSAANLTQNLRTADGRIHVDLPEMLGEIASALSVHSDDNDAFPLVLDTGRRTRWNANTIHRDPAWRKGKGPHCTALVNPALAEKLALKDGDLVRVETRRSAVELPVQLEDGVHVDHVQIPNGFGMWYPNAETGELEQTGVAVNELTAAEDRDPFTGCPFHKFARCRVVAVHPPV